MLSIDFLITAFVVVLVPGTGVIYTVSTGLTQSRYNCIAAVAGCTLGIVPHLTASIIGLSAILHMSAMVFQTIKIIGCLYLLYLAWGMWKNSGSLSFENKSSKRGFFKTLIKAVLINLLNPKLTLFFFAFLPVFIPSDSSAPTRQMIFLGFIFMFMTFVVFLLYGLLAGLVKDYVVKSQTFTKRLQKSFSVIIALMAVKLSLSKQ